MQVPETFARWASRKPQRACFGLVCLLAWAALLIGPDADGQVTVTGRGKNFVAPILDAQGRKTVLRGSDVRPVGGGMVELLKMQAETYRGQQKDMIFEAPQCVFDSKASVVSSSGALSIHTSDTRFSLEGDSFRWQVGDSRANSKLVISNNVRSLVRKRLMTPKSATNTAAAPRQSSNTAAAAPAAAPSTNEFIRVTSDTFEYEGDRAVYRGNVRAHDAEGDLACALLTVQFQGESGSVERIDANGQVVLTQGATRASADQASYIIGPATNLVEFIGHANWNDGSREGGGERILFDRGAQVLQAFDKAFLRVPRTTFGEAGLFSLFPPDGHNKAVQTGSTNSIIEVFANTMTIDLPQTNGPIRRIRADGDVLIQDPNQDGRALANQAAYEEETGILELAGSPMLQSQNRLITGATLRVDRATRILTAAPDSYVKLPLKSVGQMGIIARNVPTNAVPATNQFVEIWSKQFEYHTNLFLFRENVRANVLKDNVAQGKLTCGNLAIQYAQQIQSFAAEHKVELEQFSDLADPVPTSRRVTCDTLNAEFTAEGQLRRAVADQSVIAEMEEKRPDLPVPLLSRLTSDTVTATFAASNQVDQVVAEKDVLLVQGERTAHGAKAVYAGTTGLMELTGQPTATMPEGRIIEAERLIWDQARSRFITRGRFKSEWKRPAGRTNLITSPTALAR